MNISKLDFTKKYDALAHEEAKCWQEIENNLITNWTVLWEIKAQQYATNIIVTEVQTGNSFTYQELDDASEAIANYIRAHIQDERIGLYYENSFHFLAALIGINKTGRLAILFNTREPMSRVCEMAQRSNTKIVFGDPVETLTHFDIQTMIDTPTQAPMYIHDIQTTLEDAAFVIFTSGTSGPSKPALFNHRRMIGAGIAWSLRTFMTANDTCYIALPLYHGNALAVAFSSVLYAGATAVVRPKFSVTYFFKDINQYHCSHMVYIGELWRYLLQKYPNNPNRSLRVIFGNGLTKTLWDEVVHRYGIEHVVEHFGATEMPASALTNWFDVSGFCGYVPPLHPQAKEIILVNKDGKEVSDGEVGEALFLTPNNHYRGYLDPTLDKPKLWENIQGDGHLWWRSGDLLKRNSEGFFTFVDRAGDSYRFKGENIASLDVEEVLQQSGLVKEAVVYGISMPHIDGKVGMASLTLWDTVTTDLIQRLYNYIQAHLASYALPYFLRISPQTHTTTSTLKIQKKHLAKEAITRYLEIPHFVLLEGIYRKIDDTIYQALQSGEIIIGKKHG